MLLFCEVKNSSLAQENIDTVQMKLYHRSQRTSIQCRLRCITGHILLQVLETLVLFKNRKHWGLET